MVKTIRYANKKSINNFNYTQRFQPFKTNKKTTPLSKKIPIITEIKQQLSGFIF